MFEKRHIMKKLFFLISSIVLWCSCNTGNYLPGFDFKLFKGTSVWELAKAVEKEDVKQIEVILKDTSIKVDFHEAKFGNTLLMLAVANNKKKAVKKLLEVGANPNERLLTPSDAITPGKFCLMRRIPSMVSMAESMNSWSPVASVKVSAS